MDKANFGFKEVNFADKQKLVNSVFSGIANKYDLMNDFMSFGIHRLWKSEFIRQIPNLSSNILDVASGSGDIALKIMKKAKKRGSNLSITLSDINEEMLANAKKRAIDLNFLHNEYVICSAEELPFSNDKFDYYTIAFGIRNVPNIKKALNEAYRVLKPTGKFLCLEFSKPREGYFKKIYDFYSFNIIPQIGHMITNNQQAYQYLVESIKLFPPQDEFRIMLQEAGFSEVNYKLLTHGIVSIYSAYKL